MVEIGQKAEGILKGLGRLQRPEGFRDQTHSLRSFAKKQLIPGVKQALNSETKSIIIVAGMPGSGKSWILSQINQLLLDIFPQLNDANGLTTVTFEKDGLASARRLGLITTGPLDQRKDSELKAASKQIPSRMVEALKRYQVITCEMAVITAIRNGKELVGLDIGSSTVYPLCIGEEPFSVFNYRPYFIGSIAGKTLRDETRVGRDLVKRAGALEGDDAFYWLQKAACLTDRPVPQTTEEGEQLVLEGASDLTISRLRDEVLLHTERFRRGRERVKGSYTVSTFMDDIEREKRLFKYIRSVTFNIRSDIRLSREDICTVFNNYQPEELSGEKLDKYRLLVGRIY